MVLACATVYLCVCKSNDVTVTSQRVSVWSLCAFWPVQGTKLVPLGCPAILWAILLLKEIYRSSAPRWSQNSWCTGSWSPACLKHTEICSLLSKNLLFVISVVPKVVYKAFTLSLSLSLNGVVQICKDFMWFIVPVQFRVHRIYFFFFSYGWNRCISLLWQTFKNVF